MLLIRKMTNILALISCQSGPAHAIAPGLRTGMVRDENQATLIVKSPDPVFTAQRVRQSAGNHPIKAGFFLMLIHYRNYLQR